MQNAYSVTGTLTNARTVMLDEALPLTQAKGSAGRRAAIGKI